MATRWLLVFLGFYGTILLVGCEADEGQIAVSSDRVNRNALGLT